MKEKALPKALETESLELAKIYARERELLHELEALKIDKRRRIARIASLASGAEPEEIEPQSGSMKKRVQDYVFALELGSEIMSGKVATDVAGDPDVVSNYLSGLAKHGYLRRTGRGKYVVERTVM